MSRVSRLLLTESQRERLKKPLGDLLEGTPEQTITKLARNMNKGKPPVVIAVGDAVSRILSSAGIEAEVMIVDHREKRQPAAEFSPKKSRVYRVSNPAGGIEQAAAQAVREAIESGDALVVVDGEEDLLALPAILNAPKGALVVYGQPNVGIVLVRVDERKRSEIKKLVESMRAV